MKPALWRLGIKLSCVFSLYFATCRSCISFLSIFFSYAFCLPITMLSLCIPSWRVLLAVKSFVSPWHFPCRRCTWICQLSGLSVLCAYAQKGVGLKICDNINTAPVIPVGPWVKQWLHCWSQGMFIPHCVISKADTAFLNCFRGS